MEKCLVFSATSVVSVSCFEIGFNEKSRGYVSEIGEKIVTGMRSDLKVVFLVSNIFLVKEVKDDQCKINQPTAISDFATRQICAICQ